MAKRNIESEDDDLPPYTVNEQHASEPSRRLLGPPLSRYDKYDAAIDDAKSRRKARQDKTFVVCRRRQVIWPL
jgi:hypothetical protein